MTEANTHSIHERLRIAGHLDETFSRLLDGEKPDAVIRWLKTEGIVTSRSSLYEMVKKHGWAWRYDQARETARAESLPENMEEAAQQAIRKRLVTLTMESGGLKELQILTQIQGDTERLKLESRRVAAAEKNVAIKIHAAQQRAAAEVDEILAEADRLEALRRAREDMASRQVSDAERIEGIRRILYGEQTVQLTPEDAAAA